MVQKTNIGSQINQIDPMDHAPVLSPSRACSSKGGYFEKKAMLEFFDSIQDNAHPC